MRGAREDFVMTGTAGEVWSRMWEMFNHEKKKSRSKAIDNLQSRLSANSMLFTEAQMFNPKEILEQVMTLEKSVESRKGSDLNAMDEMEKFMANLKKVDLSDSEPIRPSHSPGADDPEPGEGDEEEVVETEGELV